MKEIDDYFQKDINRTLYHYTSVSSLLGIAESGVIWASHAYCLNDSKEILYATETLQRVITEVFSQYSKSEQAFLSYFRNMLDFSNQAFPFIFVFSLSEEKSLLSQWRSYTPHGKGVSLGFGQDMMNEILKNKGFRIAKCIYAPQEQNELLQGLINKIIISYRRDYPSISGASDESKRQKFFEMFRNDILQVLLILKHPAFKEEAEWRVISPYFPSYKTDKIKFREGGAIVLPYIEISLPKLMLSEVILGPTPHPNLSMSTLSAFLSNKSLCNKVVNPSIPYRKWG